MFKMLRLRWTKAKALSVLQNAYEMPYKQPLPHLIDTELQLVVRDTLETGGNAFDAAAAFMWMRIKSTLEAALQVDTIDTSKALHDLSNYAIGITRTRTFTKFQSLHSKALTEITAIKRQLEDRAPGRSQSSIILPD